jgi:lipid A disaccharide synthetase
VCRIQVRIHLKKKSITTPLVGHPALSEIEAKKRKKKREELGGDANAPLGLVLVMGSEQLSF